MAGIPKLIALSEQLRGKTFELTKDLYTCGRVPERDIHINDPTISSYHCDLVRSNNTYVVRDRNSTNGTRVNNVPVMEQELQNSDIIQVGGVELLYDCDDKSVMTVTRTVTGINLGSGNMDISTVTRMENVSPFGGKREKNDGRTQKIVIVIVVVLVFLVIALIGYFLWLQLRGQQSGGAAVPAGFLFSSVSAVK